MFGEIVDFLAKTGIALPTPGYVPFHGSPQGTIALREEGEERSVQQLNSPRDSLDNDSDIQVQKTFISTKGSTGANGGYTVTDHLKFRVVLPIKSAFNLLTPDEATQKALYDTTRKVKETANRYFDRTKEVALKYQTDMIAHESSHPVQDKAKEGRQYYEKMSLNDLENLQDVRKLVANDKKAKKAKKEMLSAFNLWRGAVAGGVAEDLTQDAFDDLLQEIGNEDIQDLEEDLELLLRPIRMEYARKIIKAHGVTGFIDHITKYENKAVERGLEGEYLEADFIDAAVEAINYSENPPTKPGELTAHSKILETNYNKFQSQGADTINQAVNHHFNEEIAKLIQRDEPITAEVLAGVAPYEGQEGELSDRPIYLADLLNDQELEAYAQEVETMRKLQEKMEQKLLDLQQKSNQISQGAAEIEDTQTQLNRGDIILDLDRLTTIDSQVLTQGALEKILGKGARANAITRVYQFKTQLEQLIKNDVAIKASEKSITETQGIINAAQAKMNDLNPEETLIEKQETEMLLSLLVKNYDNLVKKPRENVKEISRVSADIVEQEQELADINAKVRLIEQQKQIIKKSESELSGLKNGIADRKRNIEWNLIKQLSVSFQVKISLNELTNIANLTQGQNGHDELVKAHPVKLEQAKFLEALLGQQAKKQERLVEEQKAITTSLDNLSREKELLEKANAIQNGNGLYQKHLSELHESRIGFLKNILTASAAATRQNKDEEVEAALSKISSEPEIDPEDFVVISENAASNRDPITLGQNSKDEPSIAAQPKSKDKVDPEDDMRTDYSNDRKFPKETNSSLLNDEDLKNFGL